MALELVIGIIRSCPAYCILLHFAPSVDGRVSLSTSSFDPIDQLPDNIAIAIFLYIVLFLNMKFADLIVNKVS